MKLLVGLRGYLNISSTLSMLSVISTKHSYVYLSQQNLELTTQFLSRTRPYFKCE